MDKRHLYICGDSFSECAFLDNHYDCWVYHVAQKLDNKIINDSLGGGSNYRTVRKTLQTTLNMYDTIHTAIVVWSDPTRYEVPGDVEQKGYDRCYHNTSEMCRLYYNWLDQIQLIEKYFRLIGIEYYFVNAFTSLDENITDNNVWQQILKNKINTLDIKHWLLPYNTSMHSWGLNNGGLLADGHLNIEANRNFAEYALEVIHSRR